MGKRLSEAYKSKKCRRCGVAGKYYAKGCCNSCYTKERLARLPESKVRYERQRKDKFLRDLYGITIEDYERMFTEQAGRCAICGTHDFGAKHAKHFPVDHCHTTGRVRGLLCHSCNLGLGQFKDDPARLVSAIEYLKKKT